MSDEFINTSKDNFRSAEDIESEAEKGNPIARYLMGERYYTGTGVQQNLKKAVFYFNGAGWHGYVPAQFRLATLYFEHPDYFEDETDVTAAEKGLASLEKIFLRNSKPPRFRGSNCVGLFYDGSYGDLCDMIGDDRAKFVDNETAFKEAVRWLWNAAKQGNPVVLLALGNWFREIDEEEAKNLYRKAAEQGDPNIQLEVGNYFCEFDEEEAESWYRKAAEQGDPNIQLEIGLHFRMLDKDEKAISWYRKAAEQAEQLAQREIWDPFLDPNNRKNKDQLLYEGDDPQTLIAEWFLDVGRRFIKLDNEEAEKWLRKAAEVKDDPEVQSCIGEFFCLGLNENEGEQWLRKAAEQGNRDAMQLLSHYLKDKDEEESRRWNQKAEEAKIASRNS